MTIHRLRAALLLTALLFSSLSCSAGEPVPAASAQATAGTATFRGGPAHTGVYPSGGAPDFGGLRWRVQTEGPVRSSPAVADGRVYFGSADGKVYAVDLAGRPLWTADAGSAVSTSPAVDGGQVYVQSRTGEVLALKTADGAVAWRAETGADAPFDWGFESGDFFVSSPVVTDGKVIAGGGDGQLRAFDAQSGKPLWQVKTGGRVRSSPAVSAGVAFVGSMDGSVYAVEVATGKLKWRFDTAGRALRSAQFGFDRKSIQSSPAVADGMVYIGGRDGFLYALDAATGKERWRFDHQVSWVITSPAVRDGRVYAGSSDAKFLQAVDARTGKELWRVPTPGPVWSSPALAGAVLYVGDSSGALHAYEAQSGKERWSYALGGALFGSPVPIAGAVLVGSSDGALYAVGAGEGGPLRRMVFWDAAYERSAWVPDAAATRDYLAARGYEVMDAHALAAALETALRDGSARRSVVVFAIDHLPPELTGPDPAKGLLRRFLDAGGKVVWPGVPPLIWPKDPKTGDMGTYAAIRRDAPLGLLGVDFAAANFDRYGTRLTPAGRAWGLQGWWLSRWAVDPRQVTETLAFNENGLAAAWVKSYGGPPGTGFVALGRAAGTDPAAVLAVADYRPRPDL